LPTVNFIAELSRITGTPTVTVAGDSVREVIEALKERFGDAFTSKLFPGGEPSPEFAILLNGRNTRFLDGLETALSDDDTISLIPIIAGGS